MSEEDEVYFVGVNRMLIQALVNYWTDQLHSLPIEEVIDIEKI